MAQSCNDLAWEGVDMLSNKSLLGHSDNTTMGLYAQVNVEMKQALLEKVYS